MAIPLGNLVIIELAVDKFEDGGALFQTRHHSVVDSRAQAFCVGTPLLVGQDEASIEGGMMQVAEECAPHFLSWLL